MECSYKSLGTCSNPRPAVSFSGIWRFVMVDFNLRSKLYEGAVNQA